MNRGELVKRLTDLTATMNTIALALYGVQTESNPKALVEDIARVAKSTAEQCEVLVEGLEEL